MQAERWITAVFYTLVLLAVVFTGRQLAGVVTDYLFYKQFLETWQYRIENMPCQNWPQLEDQALVPYMDALRQCMGLSPESAYIYEMQSLLQRNNRIFLLVLKDHAVLYSVPASTAQRLDQWIDKGDGLHQGNWQAQPSLDGINYTAQWWPLR